MRRVHLGARVLQGCRAKLALRVPVVRKDLLGRRDPPASKARSVHKDPAALRGYKDSKE